jgi:hypothetical protein
MRCGQNWKVKGSRMENEYTVEQRAEITKKSMPPLRLDARQKRRVEESFYTLSEAGDLPRLEFEHATLLWAAVEMVKAGSFTDEMRL